jgi:Tfp pilus assembly protein PilX
MRRLLSSFRDDEGIALVMALGILIVISTVTIAMLAYASSNVRTARSLDRTTSSRELAEAGIAEAEAILNGPNVNASSPILLGCSTSQQNINNSAAPCTPLTASYSTGTVSYYGLYTQGQSSGTWTITSTGTVANASGGGAVTKTMTAAISVVGGGQGNNISVWNYVYSTAPQGSGCEVDLNGNHTTINVPLYVTGDLCLSGDHASVIEDQAAGGQAVDLRVMGGLTITGNHASVGMNATQKVTSGYVAQGCRSSGTGSYHPCTSADRYWVNQTDSPLTASPPTVDVATWYSGASPGPAHPCDGTLTPNPRLTASQPYAFDNDTTANGTNTTFQLTPTSSDYNCVTSTGTLSWNHTTHVLTINGTVFFDGGVQLTDSSAMYARKATIYVNGELDFNDGHGGIICGRFTFADHTQIYPLPTITSLPPGAPIPPNAPATIGPPVVSD